MVMVTGEVPVPPFAFAAVQVAVLPAKAVPQDRPTPATVWPAASLARGPAIRLTVAAHAAPSASMRTDAARPVVARTRFVIILKRFDPIAVSFVSWLVGFVDRE